MLTGITGLAKVTGFFKNMMKIAKLYTKIQWFVIATAMGIVLGCCSPNTKVNNKSDKIKITKSGIILVIPRALETFEDPFEEEVEKALSKEGGQSNGWVVQVLPGTFTIYAYDKPNQEIVVSGACYGHLKKILVAFITTHNILKLELKFLPAIRHEFHHKYLLENTGNIDLTHSSPTWMIVDKDG